MMKSATLEVGLLVEAGLIPNGVFFLDDRIFAQQRNPKGAAINMFHFSNPPPLAQGFFTAAFR
jgi:hypothetical protein